MGEAREEAEVQRRSELGRPAFRHEGRHVTDPRGGTLTFPTCPGESGEEEKGSDGRGGGGCRSAGGGAYPGVVRFPGVQGPGSI